MFSNLHSFLITSSCVVYGGKKWTILITWCNLFIISVSVFLSHLELNRWHNKFSVISSPQLWSDFKNTAWQCSKRPSQGFKVELHKYISYKQIFGKNTCKALKWWSILTSGLYLRLTLNKVQYCLFMESFFFFCMNTIIFSFCRNSWKCVWKSTRLFKGLGMNLSWSLVSHQVAVFYLFIYLL